MPHHAGREYGGPDERGRRGHGSRSRLRVDLQHALRKQIAARRILIDETHRGRATHWGGSDRTGAFWTDRSYGLADTRPVSGRYRVARHVKLEDGLDPTVIDAMKAFAIRH